MQEEEEKKTREYSVVHVSGGYLHQAENGNIVRLELPYTGTIQKEFTTEMLQHMKDTFLESLDKAITEGKIKSENRKKVILNLIIKNPKMLQVFDIK